MMQSKRLVAGYYYVVGCGIKEREMKTINIDLIIEENAILMKEIKENRERFWKKIATALQKRK